jgi:hypothetical protein
VYRSNPAAKEQVDEAMTIQFVNNSGNRVQQLLKMANAAHLGLQPTSQPPKQGGRVPSMADHFGGRARAKVQLRMAPETTVA